MEYDLIYPDNHGDMNITPCIIAAVYFDEDELIRLGVPKDSLEVQEPFWDYNEFKKAFELWSSPAFLSDFFDKYQSFFEQDYWKSISEEEFQTQVLRSLNRNRKELMQKMSSNDFCSLVNPLDDKEETKRLSDSIKVKIKQGVIKGHFPFRFYAIEIEEKKCYLITGATIKVHKDMGKAPNTKIELKKLEKVYGVLDAKEVKTKETFIDFFNKEKAKQ